MRLKLPGSNPGSFFMADDKDCFVDATGAPDLGPEFTQEKIIEAVSSTISA